MPKKIKSKRSKKIDIIDTAKDISKDVVGDLKKVVASGLYAMIFFNILVIIYISFVINYLMTLQQCPCYETTNKQNYANITYLIVIESFILIMNLFSLIGLCIVLSKLNSVQKGGAMMSSAFPFLILLSNIILYGFFVYYVKKIYENTTTDCECTQSWLRYLLYIQTFFMIIYILVMMYNLFSKIYV